MYVEAIFTHKYRNKIYSRYDVALLKLENGIDINKFTPVCLPTIGADNPTETGWSYGENNNFYHKQIFI